MLIKAIGIFVVLAVCAAEAQSRSAEETLQSYLAGDFKAERLSRGGVIETIPPGPNGCEYVAALEFDYDVDPYFVASSFRVISIEYVSETTRLAKVAFEKLGEIYYPCGVEIVRQNRVLIEARELVIVSIELEKSETNHWMVINPTKPFVDLEVLVAFTTAQLKRLEATQVRVPNPRREVMLDQLRTEHEWLGLFSRSGPD